MLPALPEFDGAKVPSFLMNQANATEGSWARALLKNIYLSGSGDPNSSYVVYIVGYRRCGGLCELEPLSCFCELLF